MCVLTVPLPTLYHKVLTTIQVIMLFVKYYLFHKLKKKISTHLFQLGTVNTHTFLVVLRPSKIKDLF